jgi:hypothetical protein
MNQFVTPAQLGEKALVALNGTQAVEDTDQPEQEDTLTDIIPYNGALATMIAPLRDGSNLALHEQMLVNGYAVDGEIVMPTPSRREEIANLYYGLEPEAFVRFVGQELQVDGMMIFEQKGGWKGKPVEKNGPSVWHVEGYLQVRLLAMDRNGEPHLIKSGGAGMLEHVYYILGHQGWFLFEQPITYRFKVGGNNYHMIYNVAHDLKRTAKKGAK